MVYEQANTDLAVLVGLAAHHRFISFCLYALGMPRVFTCMAGSALTVCMCLVWSTVLKTAFSVFKNVAHMIPGSLKKRIYDDGVYRNWELTLMRLDHRAGDVCQFPQVWVLPLPVLAIRLGAHAAVARGVAGICSDLQHLRRLHLVCACVLFDMGRHPIRRRLCVCVTCTKELTGVHIFFVSVRWLLWLLMHHAYCSYRLSIGSVHMRAHP